MLLFANISKLFLFLYCCLCVFTVSTKSTICRLIQLKPAYYPKHKYTMKHEDGTLHELEKVDQEKDLGVIIDNQIKFSTHIAEAVNKANRTLGCLRHTFKHLDPDTFLMLYKALVRPHLEYASPVW
jgi:hypothetical protein